MIKAIFFSKFDTHEGRLHAPITTSKFQLTLTSPGPKVLHQVPSDSIVPSPTSTTAPLFPFSSISSYIIPRQEFCDRPLTICVSRYRVLGYPVCITHHKYNRNEFIFNFCIVLEDSGSAGSSGNDHDDEPVDVNSYLSVVNKLARLMRGLEEQDEFLSKDLSPPGTGKVYALCEMILEDLNNYCECMIPIGTNHPVPSAPVPKQHPDHTLTTETDDSNTLNIKLFPTLPPPPPLHYHHVPLSTVNLPALTDANWDLTLLALLPHINGINSVRAIAALADADPHLTRTALRHLLYYACLLLLDVFSFAAIYACTAEIGAFVADAAMQEECARYVSTRGVAMDGHRHGEGGEEGEGIISGETLVTLYTALTQGQSVRTWCVEHGRALEGVDVRRLVTFGVIKGFLYRVHKYAIATPPHSAVRHPLDTSRRSSLATTASLATVDGDKDDDVHGDDEAGEARERAKRRRALGRYLDGRHCFDEICTDLGISERELMGELKRWGEVQIVHR